VRNSHTRSSASFESSAIKLLPWWSSPQSDKHCPSAGASSPQAASPSESLPSHSAAWQCLPARPAAHRAVQRTQVVDDGSTHAQQRRRHTQLSHAPPRLLTSLARAFPPACPPPAHPAARPELGICDSIAPGAAHARHARLCVHGQQRKDALRDCDG
jgi:hypothetical protein